MGQGPATIRAPWVQRVKAWAQETPSVLDGPVENALRAIARTIGADDPSGQILGMMGALETGPAGGVAGALEKVLERATNKIRAFHGSPHEFDQFSLDRIGTGEGAQAYGHGLYFAENEDVARSYRQLGARKGWQVGEDIFEPGSPQYRAAEALASEQKQPTIDAEAYLWDRWKRYGDDVSAQAIPYVKRWKAEQRIVKRPGAMYEVEINADPETFLDWDQPLSQQGEPVKAAARNLGFDVSSRPAPEVIDQAHAAFVEASNAYHLAQAEGRATDAMIADVNARYDEWQRLLTAREMTGEALHSALWAQADAPMNQGRQSAIAASELQRRGVSGIRYKDQLSRASGEGTSNYVVFDDRLVTILRKYGVAGALGAGYSMEQIRRAQQAAPAREGR